MAKDGFAGYDPKSNYGERWDEIFKKKEDDKKECECKEKCEECECWDDDNS